MHSILDKALLNEKNNSLSRQLHRILNQVYVFTYKKVKFFFPQALAEWDRQAHGTHSEDHLSDNMMFNNPNDSGHTKQIVDQMVANHSEFFKYLMQFKVMLGEQKSGQVDLKYMLFRLDFNEYYHERQIKEEDRKKREQAANNG